MTGGTGHIGSVSRRLDVVRTGSGSVTESAGFRRIQQCTYLKGGTEGIEQDSEEQNCTSGEERVGSLGQIVEDTTDDERHHEVTEELCECQTGISF